MRHILKNIACCLVAATAMLACTEDTGTMGIIPIEDGVSSSQETFKATTHSVLTGPVVANNANAYLGNIADPETGGLITASFATQFHCFENYSLPNKKQMVGEIKIDPATGDTLEIERGVVKCDSVEVRIFLSSFYGDGNNPMKLEVYALDQKTIMEEGEEYQTDHDLTKYVKDTKPLATKVFTPTDYIISEAERESDTYNNNIRILLPKELGQGILEKYYENKKYFQDSYHFIRNVFAGLYFRISNGEGTMLTSRVCTFNVFFNFIDEKNPGKIEEGLARFSATPEVIQSSKITNNDVEKLLAEDAYTYLKTPAGLCTEMELPIDEIFGKNPNDSVSQAKITFTRYNKVQDMYQLGTPSSLLMVRKGHLSDFFKNNEVANGRTSYIASFSSAYNSYTFANIARMLAYCKHEKMENAKKEGISEAEWAAKNPDWNKVILVPVVATTNSSNVLTNVTHDMTMKSVKLFGGKDKIDLHVIYSKFHK